MSRIRDERKAAILLAARSEFCEKGLDAASMAEIARRAGIGKSTIYEYFTSKDELLQQACAQVWDTILEELEQDPGEGDTFRERLLRYYHIVERIMEQLGGNLTLLLTNDPIRDTLYECVEEFQQVLFRRIGQAVSDGVASGELSPDLDVKAVTVLLATLPSPILLGSMRRAGVEHPMDQVLDMVLQGIGKPAKK